MPYTFYKNMFGNYIGGKYHKTIHAARKYAHNMNKKTIRLFGTKWIVIKNIRFGIFPERKIPRGRS